MSNRLSFLPHAFIAVFAVAFSLSSGVVLAEPVGQSQAPPSEAHAAETAQLGSSGAKHETVEVQDSLESRSPDASPKSSELDQLALELINQKVEAQNWLITRGLTAIGLLLAVVGLIFPAASYFLNIRPAQETLKEARQTIDSLDEKFADLLSSYRQKELDGAIRTLQESEGLEAAYAANALQLALIGRQATDDQIGQLVHVARGTDDSDMQRTLYLLLAAHKTRPVATLFRDLVSDLSQVETHHQAVGQYLSHSGDVATWGVLKAQLLEHGTPSKLITSLANAARSLSRNSIHRFADDRDLVFALGPGARRDLYSNLSRSGSDTIDLSQTVLGQSVQRIDVVTLWRTKEGRQVEVTIPDDAEQMIIYQAAGRKQHVSSNDPRFSELMAQYDSSV